MAKAKTLMGLLFNDQDPRSDENRLDSEGFVRPMCYGKNDNVLYFDTVQGYFCQSLAHWIETHPEKEVCAVSSDNSRGYGLTSGYIVVVKDKN